MMARIVLAFRNYYDELLETRKQSDTARKRRNAIINLISSQNR